jgi:hypothetical protein
LQLDWSQYPNPVYFAHKRAVKNTKMHLFTEKETRSVVRNGVDGNLLFPEKRSKKRCSASQKTNTYPELGVWGLAPKKKTGENENMEKK